MRRFGHFVLISAVGVIGLSGDSSGGELQDSLGVRQECSVYSEAEMRICLLKKAGESETKLKEAEDYVLGRLAKWDEDTKYVALAKAKLMASSLAFVRYRETQCAFAESLGGGAVGNGLAMLRLGCVFELNIRRAEQLKVAVDSLILK
ncbi:lysozyme inhibitor LprI family protein [Methylococcus mesophilus]|uniref:lysozyme inhibitor LprI family protein n=1 Tax=Methylococcus mesophilus TaxID=2993564 RepID=UPI00224B9ABC|nr:lysozyme inhibitor LprI family protein [Methylococcus mesophilus]UZR27350.1 DUF1311 domain-containing protein [Methylococcus mesophilus]